MTTMTVDELFDAFTELPVEKQELFRGKIDAVNVDVDGVFVPSPEQQADIERSLKAIEDGDVYGEDEMRAMLFR